eukprot:TRINITY_DN12657_c0_g1_i1.p1 TRINITY_DN12657_c0_g1~~TRINITY_DN12657_c0_g1_i1.p1  ORF type:complete len:310 (-),score=97.57 TRINITY_DN12657_c0_g1_i1:268-1197(-)
MGNTACRDAFVDEAAASAEGDFLAAPHFDDAACRVRKDDDSDDNRLVTQLSLRSAEACDNVLQVAEEFLESQGVSSSVLKRARKSVVGQAGSLVSEEPTPDEEPALEAAQLAAATAAVEEATAAPTAQSDASEQKEATPKVQRSSLRARFEKSAADQAAAAQAATTAVSAEERQSLLALKRAMKTGAAPEGASKLSLAASKTSSTSGSKLSHLQADEDVSPNKSRRGSAESSFSMASTSASTAEISSTADAQTATKGRRQCMRGVNEGLEAIRKAEERRKVREAMKKASESDKKMKTLQKARGNSKTRK